MGGFTCTALFTLDQNGSMNMLFYVLIVMFQTAVKATDTIRLKKMIERVNQLYEGMPIQ